MAKQSRLSEFRQVCIVCGLKLEHIMVIGEHPYERGKHLAECFRCGANQTVEVLSNLVESK